MSDTDSTSQSNTSRTPIVAVLGHVDHGKMSLLDKIRGSAVSEGEAGAITQHIGVTAVSLDTVSQMVGSLVKPEDFDLSGLLFIDMPGHYSFSTLHSRGGAPADIAILVVDVNDSFQPQTEEAIDILKRTGVPSIVAANKIDTTPGWNPQEGAPIQKTYEEQSQCARSKLDEKLYEIIGELFGRGFSSDFYWRVQNFQSNIGVVPTSVLTDGGIPDLLGVLMGPSQRYMKDEMVIDVAGPGFGTVLEVKEERGFGAAPDVVLHDGTIRAGDTVVVDGANDPIVAEVCAFPQSRPNAEIRTEKRFDKVEEVCAAAGVKVATPDLENVMAGAPVRVVGDRDPDEVVCEVEAELTDIGVTTEEEDVVVKADTPDSLEAMANALQEVEVPIPYAEVGDVAPHDVAVASTAREPEHEVILGFNVDVLSNAEVELDKNDVKLFEDDVIYQLVEEYEDCVNEMKCTQQETTLDKIVRPCRFRILQDYVPRQNNPAVIGVEVMSGTIKNNMNVVKWEDGEPNRVGQPSGIQENGEDVSNTCAGSRVSAAIDGPTVGRQIAEGDELRVEFLEKHTKILEQELRDDIPIDELETLSGYLGKHRRRNPFWGK